MKTYTPDEDYNPHQEKHPHIIEETGNHPLETRPWLRYYPSGVPASLNYPQKPVGTLLTEKAEQVPDKVCTVYKDQIITYRQMDALTDALAMALVKLGIKKGDRVALFLPNLPQFVLAFFGVLKAGGVVTAINPAYKEGEVLFQLSDAGAKVVICLAAALPLFQSLRPRTAVKSIIITNPEDASHLLAPVILPNPSKDVYGLASLLAENHGVPGKPIAVSPEDAAIFQYSGGTTGTPKGAVCLHRNLMANIMQFSAWLQPVRSDPEAFLAAIPLFHVFGMVIAMGVAIMYAAAIVLTPDPRNLPDLLGCVERNKVTIFPAVPNLLNNINHYLENSVENYDLGSLRLVISGSAPLMQPIQEKFEQLTGSRVVEGYGLSEAPTALICNPVLGDNRKGSIGLPLPDVECRIISLEDALTALGPGKAGELIARSPQVMAKYHNQPAETRLALREGWLYTGDVAYMDNDGYFYLVDRKKDVIKVGGLQVWPREVEEAIASHPKVLEVGVAGINHPDYGETVKAWVVVKPGEILTAEEVVNWCKEKLADYKAPRVVKFIVKLPRTTVGKVLRRELGEGG